MEKKFNLSDVRVPSGFSALPPICTHREILEWAVENGNKFISKLLFYDKIDKNVVIPGLITNLVVVLFTSSSLWRDVFATIFPTVLFGITIIIMIQGRKINEKLIWLKVFTDAIDYIHKTESSNGKEGS